MRTLPAPESDHLEEHLLICEDCQDRLTATDEYVVAMKAEAKTLNGGGDSGVCGALQAAAPAGNAAKAEPGGTERMELPVRRWWTTTQTKPNFCPGEPDENDPVGERTGSNRRSAKLSAE
jgi:hypothetical protein